MIEYFKLKNFISYRDETELSFVASNKSGGKNEVPVSWYKIIDGKRILKLLLGIGLNGTGKTKMIRGLSYLRRLATLKPEKPTEKPDYRPFLLDEYSAKEPTEMWLSYYINEENFLYYIKVNRDRIEEEELRIQTNGRSSRIYRRVYNYEKETIEISFGQSSDLNKNDQRDLEVNIVNNATVLSQFGSMNLESRILRLNYDYFENRISRVHQGDKTLADKLNTGNKEHDERMKELLLKLLSDIGSNIVDYHVDISSVSVDEIINGVPDFMADALRKQYPSGFIENKTLRFEHSTSTSRKSLDSSFESLGTINIIRLMIVLYDVVLGKKCTCIDELGTGIHNIALEFILKMYLSMSEESQVLVATHDLALLDPRYLNLRRDAVRKFTKDKDGVTHVERPDYLHKTLNMYKKYLEELEEDLPDVLYDNSILDEYKNIVRNKK